MNPHKKSQAWPNVPLNSAWSSWPQWSTGVCMHGSPSGLCARKGSTAEKKEGSEEPSLYGLVKHQAIAAPCSGCHFDTV